MPHAPVVALTPKSGPLRHSETRKYVITPRPRSKKPAKATQKYVKKQIDSNKETHEVVFTGYADGAGSSYSNHQYAGIPTWNNLTNTGELMRLFPAIEQGDTRQERTGSRIKLMNINCKFLFHVSPDFAQVNANSALACRLLVLSSKQFTKWTEMVTEWSAGANLGRKYLRNGEAQTYFQGDLLSLEFPVNTALFTTHYDRRFVLNRGKNLGDDSSGLARMVDPVKMMNLNLKVKNKVVQYADSGISTASNYAPFAILLYAPVNGDISTTSPGPITGNVIVKPTWKDL